MFKGYYTLTSGMLSQNKKLSVTSNNIVNATTPGFKRDYLVSTTFQDEILSRYGNETPYNASQLGGITMANVPSQVVTDYSQGGFEDTGGTYDFALNKPGFFQIQTADGVYYSRSGAFIVDDERYLSLPRVGRVLGEDGQPIQINDDIFSVDSMGTISSTTEVMGRIAVVDFPDYTQLRKVGEGLYEGGGQPTPVADSVSWKTLETSNVSMVKEMTDMITSQRAIQSSSQIVKIYDQMMAKATTDIGRV